MMLLLAQDNVPDGTSNSDREVAIAIIDEPTFVGKSSKLLGFLERRLSELGAPAPATMRPHLTFIAGIRHAGASIVSALLRCIADRPRCGVKDVLLIAQVLFFGTRQLAHHTLSLASEFLSKQQIVLVDIGKDERTYSSTAVRDALSRGNDDGWKRLVPRGVEEYITKEKLYSSLLTVILPPTGQAKSWDITSGFQRSPATTIARSVELVTKLRAVLASRPKLLWSSAAIVAALALLLRYYTASRKAKYILNLSSVGVTSGQQASQDYDVIIVGGGTSGCVLAARLTEDPSIRVLVLEAGGRFVEPGVEAFPVTDTEHSGRQLPFSRIPSGFSKLFWTKHVYRFITEPQVFAKSQKRFFPRAKLLGGCSSINAQMAQYGAPDDFDQWAALTGDESWSWKNLRGYFKKFEKYKSDPAYPLVDTADHGADGPVRIGYFNHVSVTSKAFLRACAEVGIPLVPDFNVDKGPIGASRVMTYVDERGERVSSETAYLTQDVLSRPNLKVAIHAQVTRVLFDQVEGATRAVGVEFANSANGPRYKAHARKEVILSGGAIHSPHGIGPAKAVGKVRNPLVHDLPGVGANLVDHPVVDVYFKDKLNNSTSVLEPRTVWQGLQAVGHLVQYMMTGKGLAATNFGESAAFVRTDDPVLFPPSKFPEKLVDSTSGPRGPDLELFTTPMTYKDHGRIMFPMHTYALHCYLVRPSSRGEVSLASADPWALPSVNPKPARWTLISTTAIRIPTLDHAAKTDEEVWELVKERVETVYHPTSTCRMAPAEENGVVDSKLRVYGIKGLRVCDASIFPWIVSGHTAGACLAIGEKFSDDLKAEFRASK
ncbi:hypothetical protein C8J57DRAFT_1671770 [Mycena rebaudengoi]|nr:hypothetical protein C8J57DRAFT_1671770 [Mycena rebaudengoi]